MSDLEPGRRLGCRTVLVLTGHGEAEWAQKRKNFIPDAVVADLAETVEWILGILDEM